MNYLEFSEFERPPEGHTIMIDDSVNLKITNVLYSLIVILLIHTLIKIINEKIHLNINIGNYGQILIILFFLSLCF